MRLSKDDISSVRWLLTECFSTTVFVTIPYELITDLHSRIDHLELTGKIDNLYMLIWTGMSRRGLVSES